MGSVGKKAAAAISITAVLLSAAACGGDNGSAEGKSGKPLSKAELSSAVLTQGDVSGYTIRDESGLKLDRSARAAKKSCQPIVAAMAPETSAYDDRLALRSIVKTPSGSERSEASYQLVLSSAESESAAQQAVQDLRSAISACGSGFTATLSGEEYKIRRSFVNESDLGEKGLDFSLEYQTGMKIRYVMVQSGASSIRISASDQFARKFVAVPRKIIDAQQKKLEEAAM